MDGSSLLALAELLKPPEEERESDDVRMNQNFKFMSGKGHDDVFTDAYSTEQMALIISLIYSHRHL